jgi:hypothetical protein
MAATIAIALGQKWIERLCETLGEDSHMVKRIVVDCEVDEPIHVYVEKYADSKLINLELPPVAAIVVNQGD